MLCIHGCCVRLRKLLLWFIGWLLWGFCGKGGKRGGRAEGKEVGDELKHAQVSPPPTPYPSFAVRGANVLLRSYSSDANRQVLVFPALGGDRSVDLGVRRGFLASCRLCRLALNDVFPWW